METILKFLTVCSWIFVFWYPLAITIAISQTGLVNTLDRIATKGLGRALFFIACIVWLAIWEYIMQIKLIEHEGPIFEIDNDLGDTVDAPPRVG